VKHLIIFIALTLLCFGLGATQIDGQWNGLLDIYGTKLRLVIHITEPDSGLVATLDSPDQGAYGLVADSISFADGTVKFALKQLNATYDGTLEGDLIKGTFRQAWLELPLELSREELAAPVYNRPQTPEEPYPYVSRDVTFENTEAAITLAGTFTLPSEEGVYPAVVLVSGSGPQDRNEELMNHKPFLVLSDYLTRAGIAVLRYDDRGTASSGGDFGTATTYDLVEDALSAVAWLKTQPQVGSIGVIGHSEGGIIAPMASVKDPDIDFIVLLAGTGIPSDQLLMRQSELIMRAMGTPEDEISNTLAFNRSVYDMILTTLDEEQIRTQLDLLIEKAMADSSRDFAPGLSSDEVKESMATQLINPWMLNFIRLDPRRTLSWVQVPVLALNGSKDLQVPAMENLGGIAESLFLGGNTSFKTIEYNSLNHLFQYAGTGSPSEYGSIEETFNEAVMRDIVEWILGLEF
jgi:hypothetical protein